MDSTRQQKFARLIQKEISDLFQREGYSTHQKSLVTITNVRVTPDLGIAYVHLSIFGAKEKKPVIDYFEKQTKEIRKKLGMRIRHQIRVIPEIQFFLDESLDYVEKIEKLLKETKKND